MGIVRTGKRYKINIGVVFVLPSLIGMIIFYVIPFMDVVRMSLFKIVSGEFAGFDNYKDVFGNSAFLLATKNTLRFWLICLPLQIIVSFCIAMILVGERGKARRLKSIYLLPMAIPVACVVSFWKIFFDRQGILNSILHYFTSENVDWLNSNLAFGVLVVSYLWRNLGYDLILWMAGLAAVPEEQYEAAKVDGANGFDRFRYITVPNMKTTLFLITILSLLNSFKIFREAYLVAGEYPDSSMYMVQHLYNNWYRDFSLDKMAAASVFHFLLIFVLVMLLQKVWNKEE